MFSTSSSPNIEDKTKKHVPSTQVSLNASGEESKTELPSETENIRKFFHSFIKDIDKTLNPEQLTYNEIYRNTGNQGKLNQAKKIKLDTIEGSIKEQERRETQTTKKNSILGIVSKYFFKFIASIVMFALKLLQTIYYSIKRCSLKPFIHFSSRLWNKAIHTAPLATQSSIRDKASITITTSNCGMFPHKLMRIIDWIRREPVEYDKKKILVKYNKMKFPKDRMNKYINEIYEKHKDDDFICLQEAFSQDFNDAVAEKFQDRHIVRNVGDPLRPGVSSGLIFISKYPIEKFEFVPYKNLKSTCLLANKGFLAVDITLPGSAKKLTIYNAHLQAGAGKDSKGNSRGNKIRAEQIKMMREHSEKFKQDRIVIFTGDMNECFSTPEKAAGIGHGHKDGTTKREHLTENRVKKYEKHLFSASVDSRSFEIPNCFNVKKDSYKEEKPDNPSDSVSLREKKIDTKKLKTVLQAVEVFKCNLFNDIMQKKPINKNDYKFDKLMTSKLKSDAKSTESKSESMETSSWSDIKRQSKGNPTQQKLIEKIEKECRVFFGSSVSDELLVSRGDVAKKDAAEIEKYFKDQLATGKAIGENLKVLDIIAVKKHSDILDIKPFLIENPYTDHHTLRSEITFQPQETKT